MERVRLPHAAPFTFVTGRDGKYLLYDARIPRFYYISPEMYHFLNSGTEAGAPALSRALAGYGLLEDGAAAPEGLICGMEKAPAIDTLFLIVSRECNFACKYCHFMTNKTPREEHHLSDGQLEQYLAYFDTVSAPKGKNIIFFGGEPLLRPQIIFQTVEHYCRLREPVPELTLFTNCTLVTPELAAWLSRNEVKVIASIDGFAPEHDQMRVSGTGASTFAQTLRGYRLLQEAGCKVGISCTVGVHNVQHLDELCLRMIEELQPCNLGFNILHGLMGRENEAACDLKTVCRKMVDAYRICMEKGVYFVQAVNRLRPIVEQRPRVQDCGAYGKQIVVTPDGRIGPCEVYSSSQNAHFQRFHSGLRLENDPVFRRWANRYPIYFPECGNCHAISMCGGGCAYDAEQRCGSIEHKDERCCEQAFAFFDFARDFVLDNLFGAGVQRELTQRPLLPVPHDSLVQLFGRIDVDSERYPLTVYHKALNLEAEHP